MSIDETLKENLIADVENILSMNISDENIELLKRCFEITIGHHFASHPEPQPQELYRKIYIKSEADLPEENGFYVISRHGDNTMEYYDYDFKLSKSLFLSSVDWYLQPQEQESKMEEVTDEDIEKWANNDIADHWKHGGGAEYDLLYHARIRGAKAHRDNLIKKGE